jgi:hypothetical protein
MGGGDRGAAPKVHSYAAIGGYVAALYRNELYDLTAHPARFRSFGVSESEVRSKLWLIIRPPELDEDGKHGVYPRTDRNALLLKGGPSAGEPLPIADWAAEFSDQMPEPIREAIKEARTGEEGTLTDSVWRERLAERFGSRWRIARLRAAKGGSLTVDPTQSGGGPHTRARRKKKRGGTGGGAGGRRGDVNTGAMPGTVPAKKVNVAGGIPHFRPVRGDSLTEGMLAAWQRNDHEHAEGVVLINVDHPVLAAEIEYWQSMYPDHLADEIRKDVINTYGEIGVAKVAHSEHLKGTLPSNVVENDLRSDAALTMALLGLVAEEAVIATRVGGKYGKRRSVA